LGIELPAPQEVQRLVQAALRSFFQDVYDRVATRLSVAVRTALDAALITAPATLCPLSLPHGSPRRTEGGRWYRDRVQYRGKQGARLLSEKSLRCSCPI
jgi:hypothetical protein